jgi:Protein of unknown function (DUF1553)/Protein of unknown function (DUF1549)
MVSAPGFAPPYRATIHLPAVNMLLARLLPIVLGMRLAAVAVAAAPGVEVDGDLPAANSAAKLRNSIPHPASSGAGRQPHWAFVRPERPAVPSAPSPAGRSANPIDAFIVARLSGLGITPSREAERATLIRRVTLDLTGLPPDPEEVRAYLTDATPGAYERVVDRLLASPHFGERMAQDWLDAARFADTNGYQVDRDRELWAWRDWVIGAFNRNLPFNRFTLEQLAGDLLPAATRDQRVATGFHRNHMINEEGGIIPEEFLAEYCADRVETTATVWMGLTFNCARCHDHKYDPFSQRDYYSLLAFFHNVTEKGVGDYAANIRRSTPPFLKVENPGLESILAARRTELDAAEKELARSQQSLLNGMADWEHLARAATPEWLGARLREATLKDKGLRLPVTGDWIDVPAPVGASTVSLVFPLPTSGLTALRLELDAIPQAASPPPQPAITAMRLRRLAVAPAESAVIPLHAASLPDTAAVDDLALALDQKDETAWKVRITPGSPSAGWVLCHAPSESSSDTLELELVLAPGGSTTPWRCRLLTTAVPADLLLPVDIRSLLEQTNTHRSAEEQTRLVDFRKSRTPEHQSLTRRVADLKSQVDAADLAIPVTLVMEEMETPRPTFILKRGAYDRPAESVSSATPGALPPFPAGLPRNRLGLAQWLTDPAHPLTARVTVNRLWQTVFGTGLVRTTEDFGTQGDPPSHPELLDWLATEFVESGWDVKAFVRLLVTSATYRQDSRCSADQRARDPENRLLARGPRHRLPAEAIRDQALALSGLLVTSLGGPSVKPYHPPGLYEQVVAGSSASTYVQDHGSSLYRRTLYTYWKRSVPNPALLMFDMPFRESCAVRRARTSTPLQALNLLNDPTFVEAARGLAQRMMREGGSRPESRLDFGFRLATARHPQPEELEVLVRGYHRSVADFRADPRAAADLLSVGESVADPALDPSELAACTTAAGLLLNLDEVITRE